MMIVKMKETKGRRNYLSNQKHLARRIESWSQKINQLSYRIKDCNMKIVTLRKERDDLEKKLKDVELQNAKN